MSRIAVSTDELATAATRLASIPAGITDHLGLIGAHAGAAAGTPAEGAVGQLAVRFAAALPAFAHAAGQLGAAAAASQDCYRTTDAAIGAIADRERTR